ncbi:MAG: PhnD/SsuA/transferrin family substrate-binding protein, partial [Gammaproteobacteria bacterium]|nr:PhnD/SsuA/transferrin family substrate-binding protein [Gammaproteobacteria bacterium]
NARMYSATPAVKAAWRQLLQWVLARAGLDWAVIDHDPPAPLAALWARDDLGLAMMCGLPYAQSTPKPVLVAAPIPSPARYGGRAVYFTDIVVRESSSHRTIEDTFGGVLGYTLADSMSGGVALRHHLAAFARPHGKRLYRSAVGGLVNARGVIDALVAGTIDVGPLDSYYHDLLRHDEPALARQVRVVASTGAMPIPPLVASAALSSSQLSALREALAEVAHATKLQAVRERLLLSGFAFPDPADYDVLAGIAERDFATLEDI